MHIHILGICGTFMAGIAILAKQQGHHVTGSDQNVYPPMSTQLEEQGIVLYHGYNIEHLNPRPDCIVVGNTMKRGMPVIEHLLNENLPYISGPQWLGENILRGRQVLAVAGTHGKTTTTSLLAWILHHANLQPGFLIGGIAKNFSVSAQLGSAPFFVIEADEYDTAFFDKRSKFIHYHPRTLILNNLEFDHADIFSDLDAIQTQFHHLVRTVPGNGLIVYPDDDINLTAVLDKGCWTSQQSFGTANSMWQAHDIAADGSSFCVYFAGQKQGELHWSLLGHHNVRNALAAIAAAHHAGVKVTDALAALAEFKGIKRRLELRGQPGGISIYDDFAHHPTAIATTLQGLRKNIGAQRMIAVVECGSYTMRTGVHKQTLAPALSTADAVIIARPKDDWGVDEVAAQLTKPSKVCDNTQKIIEELLVTSRAGDHIVIMSNTGFDGLHEKLLTALQATHYKI